MFYFPCKISIIFRCTQFFDIFMLNYIILSEFYNFTLSLFDISFHETISFNENHAVL